MSSHPGFAGNLAPIPKPNGVDTGAVPGFWKWAAVRDTALDESKVRHEPCLARTVRRSPSRSQTSPIAPDPSTRFAGSPRFAR